MAKILIVEDDFRINHLIKKHLVLSGHMCIQSFDGNDAMSQILYQKLDLVILDIMLPEISGFDILKEIDKIPVIIVTAKTQLPDRLKGLNLGADDYISKPFEILELVARVDAVLRRVKGFSNTFEIDDILIDFNARKVSRSGVGIDLTPKEFDLLEILIVNRNLALSREKIISLVWPMDYCGDDRTVDTHIQRLRQKLRLEDRLKTVYRKGYRLEI